MSTDARADSVAQQLLDAQVAHHLSRFAGDRLAPTVSVLTEVLLDGTGRHSIEDLVDRETIKAILARALVTVPGSAAVGEIVDLVAEVVLAGPAEPYPIGGLVDRERLETLLDELLALHPLLERGLERLTASPLVGTIATRFMGRVVGEVLQANKTVADKVPGLGPLMSFGTTAASRVMGAADKQFEGLLGDAVGKGGTFAVRRLNRILIETLRDPTTRDAVLEVWDLVRRGAGRGAEPARESRGGHRRGRCRARPDRRGALANRARRGPGRSDRGRLLRSVRWSHSQRAAPRAGLEPRRPGADLVRIAPGVVTALRESGDLERILRAQLEPFYSSPEVAALIDGR